MLTLVSMPAFNAPPIAPITAASAQLNIRILLVGTPTNLADAGLLATVRIASPILVFWKSANSRRRDHQDDDEDSDPLDAPRCAEDRHEVVGIVGEQRRERQALAGPREQQPD